MEDLPDMAKDKVSDMGLGDILSIDWTVLCTGGYGVGKIACKALDIYMEIEEKIGAAIEAMSKLPDFQEALEKGELRKVVTDDMIESVNNNKCLLARKCMLVPYRDTVRGEKSKEPLGSVTYKGKTYKEQKTGSSVRNTLGLDYTAGCCPGQTGHHLVPSSWAKSACPNYDERDYPVVCAEGTSQYMGTHGSLHTHLDEIVYEQHGIKKLRVKNDDPESFVFIGKEHEGKKKGAFDMAIAAHQQMYPNSKDCAMCFWNGEPCNEECLRAQLEDAYKDCKGDFKAQLITSGQDDTSTQGESDE